MWTPKRILLFLGGFFLFFMAYEVYALFLGGIDGLRPLPEEFWPDNSATEPMPIVHEHRQGPQEKLRMAFGEGSPELLRTVKLEIRTRGMVLAADDVKVEDGKLHMSPFSIAIFGKPSSDPRAFPEINTVRSDVAHITFDRPVSSITEIGNRKIVSGQLNGDIKIINNRRTPARDDDLSLHTKGPMFYDETIHLIWTQEGVKIIDLQGKPEPTIITAIGMDVYLTAEDKEAKAPDKAKAAHKPKGDAISGVDRMRLRGAVDMALWVDAREGFLDTGSANKKPAGKPSVGSPEEKKDPAPATVRAATPDKPPEKTKVIITTPGPFEYNVNTDLAVYDIPQRPSKYPENVEVRRLHEQGKLDQLLCDHLELQFHRKTGTEAETQAARDDRSANLEIESAHATGTRVTLTSDAEILEAIGNDLTYFAKSRRSILKGNPEMVALKDGNEIHARELWLTTEEKKDPNEPAATEATALGPGRLGMLDRTREPGKQPMERTLQARWQDQLIYKKDGNLDCLTLTGKASFDDQEHDQHLRAERLKVWLEPSENKPDTKSPQPAPSSQQQRARPHHLEATGKVTADSADMHIKEPTEFLAIWFKDRPATNQLPPATPVSDQPDAEPRQSADSNPAPTPPGAASPTPAPATGGAAPPPPAQPEKPKKPMEVSAHTVKAYVFRTDNKNELDKVWCEGDVRVHQDPATPEEKGTNIRGDSLQLDHDPEGNVLLVNGKPGHVQLDKLTILGPEVHIDQLTNKAWVNGLGAMQMPTSNTLEGAKLSKPADLTIHWSKDMFFNGQFALFHGNVQAEQETGRLLCQEMQVFLDRPVSLKENNKNGTPAKVKQLVCDTIQDKGPVRIEEAAWQDKRLVGYKRLVAPTVSLDNEDSVVNAPGPGIVYILQMGSNDEIIPSPESTKAPAKPAAAGPANNGKDKPKEEVLKLTRVAYLDRFHADNTNRSAIFYGNVEVVNLPCDNPDAKIDLDHPPEGLFYMRCELLKVYSRRSPNGVTSQEMEAHRKVSIQAAEFWGQGDLVKYDESKQLVILEGQPATLWKVKGPGAPPEKVSGKKIFYWRDTGQFKIDDGQGLDLGNSR